MTPGPLNQLLRDLDQHLAEDPKGPRVARLLESYARSADDWRKFALFDATYYSRNLVRQSEAYELIVLCWNAGQRSPIHDHARQRCWMAVLEGEVRETIYQGVPEAEAGLTRGPVRTFEQGSVAYIVDDIGWHRIEPAGAAAAVTLHLYSRPIRACRVYDETTRVISSRTMSYHSVDGVPLVAAR
jgi:cysteine dioxygenase